MKIVFFGTSSFAVGILESLVSSGHSIAAIVTRPDRPIGRNLKLTHSPVKEYALKFLPNIPLFEPEKASTDAFCETVKSFSPDLFLVVAYGEIIKQNLLSIPGKGCVNIHTSLLPEYRGAAPVRRCLMDGKTVSGVTFIEMVLKMDAGAVLKQETVSIPEDMNFAELEETLLTLSKKILPEFLDNFDRYWSLRKEQDETKVSFAAKISPEDCVIDWSNTAKVVRNQIRGLSPYPGVFIRIKFGEEIKRLKILSAAICNEPVSKSGELYVDRAKIRISCSDGFLEPLWVQLEGKKAMKVDDFLRGVSKSFSLVS